MPRPGIIRADTLDLQNQDAPSAQDHSKQPIQSTVYLESGRPAPHQQKSLHEAQQESEAEMGRVAIDEDRHLDPNGQRNGIEIYEEPDEMDSDSQQLEHHNSQYDGDTTGGSEEGDFVDGDDDLMDDDFMDKISSSPSIDDEDIDFEFVYALHNFVATVEGQANAAKGDTMVLLDDSNSYWWLVRVVKDGSIAPTFIEASEMEFSSDEELDGADYFNSDDEAISQRIEDDMHDNEDSDIVIEPLKPKPKESDEPERVQMKQEPERVDSEEPRSSEESSRSQRAAETTISRSRNGTVRNTDSFFKDDSIETKKISLTPNLLRDELSTSTLSPEAKETIESNDKGVILSDKGKDDKRRKDKKSGMLSGWFKRKDKKTKAADDDAEEPEKSSGEFSSLSPENSFDGPLSPQESQFPKSSGQQQYSKPQPRSFAEAASVKSDTQLESMSPDSAPNRKGAAPAAKESIRRVFSPTTEDFPESTEPTKRPGGFQDPSSSPVSSRSGGSQTLPPAVQPSSLDSSTFPVERASGESNRVLASVDHPAVTVRPSASPPEPLQTSLRGSESPVDVSPLDPSAPRLSMDNSSPSISPISSRTSPVADATGDKAEAETPISAGVASVESVAWSDSSLRTYLDDGSDIRDLFIIVHDKSNIPPAGPDHPISGSLFREESKRLKEMANQLDEMLVDWISRRVRNPPL
ncbi:hypothetical protein MPDQ_001742 [Monascus purpureus]|uniref:SH3 domain-containing protein n=1 Tax=Monascus purpureus TaxID=5098 RepID=A0A507R0A0_MONPU|nr:hypothetical protein MPDQ_001742 [Monascus purpureus]